VDLVITDIAMQGLSGLDLLKKLKDMGLDVPVIVTTGNPSHSSAVQALRGGAFDYVVKPFHLEEIAERAEKALSTKRVKDENLLYSKLVSLHSISRVTAEAASMEDLSFKVIKLGTRLTGSDGGWYFNLNHDSASVPSEIKAFYPDPENPKLRDLLFNLAQATVKESKLVLHQDPVNALQPDWYLVLPVEVSSVLHGVLIFRRAKPQPNYDAVDLEVFSQLAATFALGIRALGFFPKLGPSGLSQGDQTLESWARLIGQMVDEHCRGYESKGERVEAIGLLLMKELKWPEQHGESWSLVCRIYEIAKMRVPQKLLEDRQVLGEEDLEFVHAQSAWACERIRAMPGLEPTARVMEDFLENYDGSGRPRGIRGSAISPLARLLAVTDAYVSMRSARPYRAALTEAEAFEVVDRGNGKRFDPEMVSALRRSQSL
jgi:response regulator RpfG family c-di-GMP phosphodiesterase